MSDREDPYYDPDNRAAVASKRTGLPSRTVRYLWRLGIKPEDISPEVIGNIAQPLEKQPNFGKKSLAGLRSYIGLSAQLTASEKRVILGAVDRIGVEVLMNWLRDTQK